MDETRKRYPPLLYEYIINYWKQTSKKMQENNTFLKVAI